MAVSYLFITKYREENSCLVGFASLTIGKKIIIPEIKIFACKAGLYIHTAKHPAEVNGDAEEQEWINTVLEDLQNEMENYVVEAFRFSLKNNLGLKKSNRWLRLFSSRLPRKML